MKQNPGSWPSPWAQGVLLCLLSRRAHCFKGVARFPYRLPLHGLQEPWASPINKNLKDQYCPEDQSGASPAANDLSPRWSGAHLTIMNSLKTTASRSKERSQASLTHQRALCTFTAQPQFLSITTFTLDSLRNPDFKQQLPDSALHLAIMLISPPSLPCQ